MIWYAGFGYYLDSRRQGCWFQRAVPLRVLVGLLHLHSFLTFSCYCSWYGEGLMVMWYADSGRYVGFFSALGGRSTDSVRLAPWGRRIRRSALTVIFLLSFPAYVDKVLQFSNFPAELIISCRLVSASVWIFEDLLLFCSQLFYSALNLRSEWLASLRSSVDFVGLRWEYSLIVTSDSLYVSSCTWIKC